ncbi:hypothetical protein D1007_08316 [Hordeum vulgare]|nr:hypothetical protein D1007_08316 [Hordeum vulgare]
MISCSVHYVPQLLRGALHGLIWRRHGVVVAIAPGAAAFGVYDVSSYALHPDGRSFLVSTNREDIVASLVFDMEELSWKHLGNWALPFDCRGHFDPLLGTLVRLFDHIFSIFLGHHYFSLSDSEEDPDTLGQLCSSCMPGSDDTPPVTKLGKEKLFSEDPAERNHSATLACMGRRSKFCLDRIECVYTDHDDEDDPRPDNRLEDQIASLNLEISDIKKEIQVMKKEKTQLKTEKGRYVMEGQMNRNKLPELKLVFTQN